MSDRVRKPRDLDNELFSLLHEDHEPPCRWIAVECNADMTVDDAKRLRDALDRAIRWLEDEQR